MSQRGRGREEIGLLVRFAERYNRIPLTVVRSCGPRARLALSLRFTTTRKQPPNPRTASQALS